MATYLYETIPPQPDAPTVRFELEQSMKAAPLTQHPVTGEPVRRVITGGYGLMGVGARTNPVPRVAAQPAASSCGAGCACHCGGTRVPAECLG
jgi:predicted nucleic acid-binding Zn ribbon protein